MDPKRYVESKSFGDFIIGQAVQSTDDDGTLKDAKNEERTTTRFAHGGALLTARTCIEVYTPWCAPHCTYVH